MQVTLTEKYRMPDVYSLSGIEIINNQLFMIGDDAAWLYIFNHNRQLLDKIALYQTADNVSERIPKKQKADLEAMTTLNVQGKPYVFIISSGSTAARQSGFLVETQLPYTVSTYSLAPLYDLFRQEPTLVGNGKLNLEGLAVSDDTIFFLQRGNISGTNTIVAYPLEAFFAYLTNTKALPDAVFYTYQLPSRQGLMAGFSGATVFDNRFLLFTASIEDTQNEIDDGASLGSLVGLIDLRAPEQLLDYVFVQENDRLYTGKIESIAIVEQTSPSSLIAVAVTDSDGADSELITLHISW